MRPLFDTKLKLTLQWYIYSYPNYISIAIHYDPLEHVERPPEAQLIKMMHINEKNYVASQLLMRRNYTS